MKSPAKKWRTYLVKHPFGKMPLFLESLRPFLCEKQFNQVHTLPEVPRISGSAKFFARKNLLLTIIQKQKIFILELSLNNSKLFRVKFCRFYFRMIIKQFKIILWKISQIAETIFIHCVWGGEESNLMFLLA